MAGKVLAVLVGAHVAVALVLLLFVVGSTVFAPATDGVCGE